MSYIFPLGPYHPALKEPIHFKLHSEGERIKKTEIFMGYNYKGIEKLLETKNYIQSIPLIERVSSLASHSNSLAYCLSIEDILCMQVSKRANYIRVIFSEIERIQAHYLWLAHIAQIIAFDSLVVKMLNIRESILDVVELITDNRIHYGINIIGGVKKDITISQLQEILAMVENINKENEIVKEIVFNDSSIASRTKNVGVLTRDTAMEYSVSGPSCRASGVEYDVRKIKPYCNYEDFDFIIPTLENGDVFARLKVVLLEVDESLKIIKQGVLNIPQGNINLGFEIPEVEIGQALTTIESPEGELSYFIVSKGEKVNGRVSIHTATFKNIMVHNKILPNNKIANAGLIILSINPSFAGLDR